jgi:hypothetical protein
MLGGFISLIVFLIVAGFIWWAVFYKLLPLVPLPPPFATIVEILKTGLVVLIVITLLWWIGSLALTGHPPTWLTWR